MSTFMNALAKNEKSYTKNGGTAYKTSGSALVDLNFGVPYLRNAASSFYGKTDESSYYHSGNPQLNVVDALRMFIAAYDESPNYALKWMMYARHIHLGLGERDVFRLILTKLGEVYPEMVLQFILGTEVWTYGRWDDVLRIYFDTTSDVLHNGLGELIRSQFNRDVLGSSLGESISLLAKWMPSNNTSSKSTRKDAVYMQDLLQLSPREYRKTLSMLRKHLDIVDRKAALNEWHDINYNHVPSKANLKYKDAFMRHDGNRRTAYLEELAKGSESVKIHAQAMFLYDIVHAYFNVTYNNNRSWSIGIGKEDATLEALWDAQEAPTAYEDMLVVRDGSGSMISYVSSSSTVTALDVADSIALYCAQHNQSEAFKNKFITFSCRPQFVDVSRCNTLKQKLNVLRKYDDYSNTDIERTFDLILDTAVKNDLAQCELPSRILIISDMQFDGATQHSDNESVIESCRNKFEKAGYELPRLIFWNVNSYAHKTIPLQSHPSGVILVSGFSKSIVDMVLRQDLDPLQALKAELDEKCGIVDEVFKDWALSA